jgi:hypothetical protein
VVSLSDQFVTNNYDAFAMAETGLQYAKVHGHSPRFLATDALFYVPRALWPGKSEDVGVVLSQDQNFTLTNRSSPLWIESYLWGGVGVTLLVFTLLGWAHRRLDDAHADEPNPEYPEIGPAFVPVVAVFGLFYLRGSLLVAMPPLTLLIAIPLLISRRVRIDAAGEGVDGEHAYDHGDEYEHEHYYDDHDDSHWDSTDGHAPTGASRSGEDRGSRNSPSSTVRTKEIT